MGIELETTKPPPSLPPAKASKPPEAPQPSTTWAIVDCVALIGMFVLMSLRIITPSEGLPWLAMVLAARLKPTKGSGIATIAAGIIGYSRLRQ